MPFCGFNNEMIHGLEEFHEGLVARVSSEENKDSSFEKEELME